MRHLWSLLAGLVAAPLAWLFLATGQYRSSQTVANWNAESFFDTTDLIGPAAFLAAAGVLLGLLGTLRVSPAGALVAGLLLVTPTVLMFISPFETLDAFSVDQPRRLLSQDFQPWLPVENGTLLVLGALLLMAVFSAQRWRRWPLAAPVAVVPAAVTERQAPQPMSDEEILAAAAEMEKEEQATAAGKADEAATEETERVPEPVASERAASDPVASDPAASDPAASDPPATKPVAAEPEPPASQTAPERTPDPDPDPDPDPAPEDKPRRDPESSSSTRSGAAGTG